MFPSFLLLLFQRTKGSQQDFSVLCLEWRSFLGEMCNHYVTRLPILIWPCQHSLHLLILLAFYINNCLKQLIDYQKSRPGILTLGRAWILTKSVAVLRTCAEHFSAIFLYFLYFFLYILLKSLEQTSNLETIIPIAKCKTNNDLKQLQTCGPYIFSYESYEEDNQTIYVTILRVRRLMPGSRL